jgi:lysophospholipase L1-like esterase
MTSLQLPRISSVILALLIIAPTRPVAAQSAEEGTRIAQLLQRARRIVFLGDSITYGGKYVVYVEAWLTAQRPDNPPLVINVGLPSETVSGLSEPGHADGRFPRPDLATRLRSVLEVTRPDLVFACYGINCGIYQPFDEARFACYQQGIQRLQQAVADRGAELVLITPPTYDDQRGKLAFSYDDVMRRYSDWLLSLREHGTQVIDLHGPMTQELQQRRQSQPEFTFQSDAVHPGDAGHWFMARQVIRACTPPGTSCPDSPQAVLSRYASAAKLLSLTEQRMALLRNAHLTAAGHGRPGIPRGVPLDEASAQADAITEEIQQLMAQSAAAAKASAR